MIGFLAKRVVRLLSVLFAVTVLSFLLVNLLPGDPVLAILGPAAGDPVAHAQVEKRLELDKPIPVRYVHWLDRAVHGDLGQSYTTNQSVLDAIGERLPVTLEMMILAEVLALVVSIPLGVLAVRKPDGWFDRITGTSMFALLALPAYILGVLLVYVFAVKLKLVPATGVTTWFTIGKGVVGTPTSLALPIITLAASQVAVFARLLRSEMLTTLRADFILMARAKGVRKWRILIHHALRPSSFSLVTVLGLTAAALVGGTIIVEDIFAINGMGRLIVQSIESRNYLVIQGCVVLISVAFVLLNFAVDLLYGVLDPRIRRGALAS